MSDQLVRAISKDGFVKAAAVSTRALTERARQIHQTSPVATAALGRLLAAGSMMGNELKGDGSSVTLRIKGDGPLGTLLVVADNEGNVRGSVQNPQIDLPIREDGKLDVGGAVGHGGTLTVIKDLNLKEPYVGSVELLGGEIAEDLASYFVESEQIPTACGLGVLVDRDRSVLRAGGYLIQLLPGAPEGIIDRAGQLLERGDIAFEDVLSAIEKDKQKAEAERDEAAAISLAMKQQQEALARREAVLAKKEKELLAAAREEARAIVREAKDTAAEVQKELRALAKEPSLGERTKRLEHSKRKLRESENKYAVAPEKLVNYDPVLPEELKVGDRVKLLTLDQNGEVLTLPDARGDLMVSVGIMKINANVQELMLIRDGGKQKKPPRSAKYGSLYRSKAQNISSSVNVQGKTLDEAIMDVDKYLDDAYMAGLREVTVIHGLGTGVLRTGLRQAFRRHKHVDTFRKGAYNEGGDGVTIVSLKE